MEFINYFVAKSLAHEAKKNHPEISNVKIISEISRFVFVFEISHNENLIYNFISVIKDSYNHQDFLQKTSKAVKDACFSLDIALNDKQILQQYQLRFLFHTGKYAKPQ